MDSPRLGTVLLIWKFSVDPVQSSRRTDRRNDGADAIFVLLYAPNATAEMPLTFFCTWAAFHFSRMAIRSSRRTAAGTPAIGGIRKGRPPAVAKPVRRSPAYAQLLYCGLGLAMLTKGPAPLPMLAFPLAVWWYAELPLAE